jgi:hypothetical protein
MRLRLLVPLAGVCLGAVLTASCGGGGNADAAASTAQPPPVLRLPSKMLGLNVKAEDIKSEVDTTQQPFIDSVGLFAFRERADLLDATLEVARFTRQAQERSSDFRGSIVSRIGGTNPLLVRFGNQPVYLTSGRNQIVFIWFKKRDFFVLTVRRDFPFPRTLTRKIINLDIG